MIDNRIIRVLQLWMLCIFAFPLQAERTASIDAYNHASVNISNSTENTPQTTSTKKNAWTALFSSINDTVLWQSHLSKSFPKEGWAFENGELTILPGKKAGDVMTRKMYSNFELSLEFNMSEGVNSGVKYFVDRMKNNTNGKTGWIGFEYQIIDDFNAHKIKGYEGLKGSTGAMYLIYGPNFRKKHLKPAGEWNTMKIRVKGRKVEHWLNGKKVLKVNLNSKDFQANLEKTKFANYDEYGKLPAGYILLQDHGTSIRFRNIMIREVKCPCQKHQ